MEWADSIVVAQGSRLGYTYSVSPESHELFIGDVGWEAGQPSWRQRLLTEVRARALPLPSALSPKDSLRGGATVWLGQHDVAAVLDLTTRYWPPFEPVEELVGNGADERDAFLREYLRYQDAAKTHPDLSLSEFVEYLWSSEIIAVSPRGMATVALLAGYRCGSLHLAWRWTGEFWEAIPLSEDGPETRAWVLGNGRAIVALWGQLWVTEKSVMR